MQSEIEELIRQNPQMTIREVLVRYREQCQQVIESISDENIRKIDGYFHRLC